MKTHEQRMAALSLANERRMKIARVRRELAEADRASSWSRLAELLEHPTPAVAVMPVERLLRSARYLGPAKARRLRERAGVGATKRLRQTTERQRRMIAEMLRARLAVARERAAA